MMVRGRPLEETRLVRRLYASELRSTLFNEPKTTVEVPAQVAKRPL